MFKIVFLLTSLGVCNSAPPELAQPCELKDRSCIAANLAANFNCNPQTREKVPAHYLIPRFRFETPFFNATYIDRNLITRNHDKCYVSAFYFNLHSDTVVLTIDCRNLSLESTRTLIQHQSFLEDSFYNYFINGTYPLIRLTTTLSPLVDLCSSFTFADVKTLPKFKINPKDNSTANFLSRELARLNIYERESFFYRAPWLARFFINRALCDFGCDS